MTEINSILDLLKYPSTLGIPFGEFILIATFLISFLSLKKYKTGPAFAAATFITTVTATLLTFLGLISAGVLPALVLLTAISIAVLFLSEKFV